MPSTGIMQQIRSLLSQGNSSSEVIARGFKSSTVYKTQAKMAEAGMAHGPAPENAQARNHEPPEPSKVGIPLSIETVDPEVEANPDIVQLKIELRKAHLQRQLDELRGATGLESRVGTLETRMDEIFTEFGGLEAYVYACPLADLRDEFKCSCGAEEQVAAMVVCTACGTEAEYSWWTRPI